MRLSTQKRIAARVLKCSPDRIKLDESRHEDIKEAITKRDVRALISEGAIKKLQKKGNSRVRARITAIQKKKGRQKGHGSRKGRAGARLRKKTSWMNKVRIQRTLLRTMREKDLLESKTYQMLYMKIKGGFFRSKRHLQLYIEEQNLIRKIAEK